MAYCRVFRLAEGSLRRQTAKTETESAEVEAEDVCSRSSPSAIC